MTGARLRGLAAFGAGLVFALGQPPVDLWPVALLGLVGIVWLFDQAARPGQAALWGWLFGLGYFGLSLIWLVEPFLVDAAVTGLLAPVGPLGMAAGLSLFWAAAFALAHRLGGTLALVSLWTLAEIARGSVLTGFPWGTLGYVFAPTPVAQWAQFVGPYGLGGMALAIAVLWSRPKRAPVLAATGTALLIALYAGGAALTPPLQETDDRPVVRLLQPNAPQHLKWHPDHVQGFFRRQLDFTGAGKAPDLIVWPETALPMWLHQAEEALGWIAERARGAEVITGVQRFDGGYYNSLVALGPAGETRAIYDKHHLVPFGEYMPLPWLWSRIHVFGLAARADGGFSPGEGPSLIRTEVGIALPLICYEAVFPQDVRAVPERPDYLLHLTNDAWFGSWSGPYQHLMQARMRAIETGLPLIRAANTGVSAVIDPAGRILQSLPLNTNGFIDAALPRAEVATVYWRWGDAPVLVLCLALAALAGLNLARRKKTKGD